MKASVICPLWRCGGICFFLLLWRCGGICFLLSVVEMWRHLFSVCCEDVEASILLSVVETLRHPFSSVLGRFGCICSLSLVDM